VKVRPATNADVVALGRLGRLLVQAHHDFDATRFLPPSPRTEEGYGSWLASQIREKDVIVLVAELDGEVVGYSYAGIEGHDWMSLRGPAGVLHDILVDPAHRARGIGAELLAEVVKVLEARGVPRIVLSTAFLNERAQRLFQRAGFRPTMIEMTRDVDRATPEGEARRRSPS
jgi:ribosomal protein S18 acetylase RimI-like enzyme